MTMTDYRKEFEKVLSGQRQQQQAASKLPASQKQRTEKVLSGKGANLRNVNSAIRNLILPL